MTGERKTPDEIGKAVVQFVNAVDGEVFNGRALPRGVVDIVPVLMQLHEDAKGRRGRPASSNKITGLRNAAAQIRRAGRGMLERGQHAIANDNRAVAESIDWAADEIEALYTQADSGRQELTITRNHAISEQRRVSEQQQRAIKAEARVAELEDQSDDNAVKALEWSAETATEMDGLRDRVAELEADHDGKQLVSEAAIKWLFENHPEEYKGFYERVDGEGT